jgi:kumamolisin
MCQLQALRGALIVPISVLVLSVDLAAAVAGPRVRFVNSVVEVPASAVPSLPHLSRNVLTTRELEQPIDFVVSLRVRDFAGLEELVQSGKTLARSDLRNRFLPLDADYDRVGAWLAQEGFTVTLKDPFRTMFFIRGTVAQIAASFDVAFARVTTLDGEFTSAVTAPSVPAELAPVVLGVVGLQPHIRMHVPTRTQAQVTNFSSHVTPGAIRSAYNVPDSLDGTGQTICVIMAATPLTSDLTTFWQDCGSAETQANYTLIGVNGGPAPDSQTANADEATLDTEWASGMAPGAQVRLYAVPDLTLTSVLYACLQITYDVGPSVISYSAAGPEGQYPGDFLATTTEAFAILSGGGYSFVSASGDAGSNPNSDTTQPNAYGAGNPLSAEYPASDPNVTAVGGTTMTLGFDWSYQGETAWSDISASVPVATGGGVSGFFPRPAWQTGVGVPAGATRCVPDLSATASFQPLAGGYTGAMIIFNGVVDGRVGTSVAAPIVAAMNALLNQSQMSRGQDPIGLLGPVIYPFIGSNAVNDVTTGNNGAYTAGSGYDLCTGVGSVNLGNLITLLSAKVSTVPPPSAPTKSGTSVSMTFTSSLAGNIQWRLDGLDITGATGASYSIAEAGAADNGEYSVIISGGSEGTFSYDVGPLATVSDARIVNLSARAEVQTGSNILIAGFVVSGTGTKSMLVRGIGPALGQFGLDGFLPTPVLTLFDSNDAVLAANTGWGGGTDLAAAMARLGAFALVTSSLDDALLQSVPVGSYTAQVSGNAMATGVALAELYDNDIGLPTSRLINISSRANVQPGSNILIAGFVVDGGPTGADETVLIRGVGPALTAFSVPSALQNPVLTLLDNKGVVIATNRGWASTSTLGSSLVKAHVEISTFATMSKVGAFGLANGALDCAMTVTLPPGSYTAQVSGANNTSGVGLVEVYEVR